MLDSYSFLAGKAPEDAETIEASFSIVVEEPGKKKRRLPSLYVGTYQVFAHRDVVEVLKRFLRTVDAVTAAVSEPIYAAHPCEIAGVWGLYGRDFFSRDPFRRKLVRRGASFAADPYVRLLADGGFESSDWGRFDPRFIVMPNRDHENESAVVRVGGALLLFNALVLRLGRAQPDELYLLRRVLDGMSGLGSVDPDALIEEIRSTS